MPNGYNPPAGCTHVLAYEPPEIMPDYPAGVWTLEAVGDWLNFDLSERTILDYEAAPDTSEKTLCKWASGELGQPVRLIGQRDEIGVPRRPFRKLSEQARTWQAVGRIVPARWICRRMYWVIPA
jgi:hypothetical protein